MALPLEVFCCYAREDQKMLMHLKKHLIPLQRQGQITIWSDTNLNAGVEWEKELHQHLVSADIILMLISPDFMASDYCYSTEMEQAIVRHNEGSAIVIPILLRTTFWQDAPFAKIQMVPTDARPIASLPNRDDAFHNIIIQLNRVISDLRIKQMQVEADETTLTVRQQISEQKTSSVSQNRLTVHTGNQQTNASSLRTINARPEDVEVLYTLRDYTGSVENIALSADGRLLASCSQDQAVKLWNAQTGKLLHTLKGYRSMALSADGLFLATEGVYNDGIKLWNTQTLQLLHTLKSHWDGARIIVLNANGLLLATINSGRKIKLWNTQTSRLLHTFKAIGFMQLVGNIALSANGHILASCGLLDCKIKIWNAQTGQLLHTLTDHTGSITSVALSADGLLLASGGGDRTIRLWNARTGQLLHTLIGHIDTVYSLALSADGLLLASGSRDQTIKLWNVPAGWLLRTLTGHTGTVYSLALSADRFILASGSEDQTIKIWSVKE